MKTIENGLSSLFSLILICLCHHVNVSISLGGNLYIIYIYITEHGGAKSQVWCTFNRFNLPGSVFATARSKAVLPYVLIICFLSILYAYCMFGSC